MKKQKVRIRKSDPALDAVIDEQVARIKAAPKGQGPKVFFDVLNEILSGKGGRRG